MKGTLFLLLSVDITWLFSNCKLCLWLSLGHYVIIDDCEVSKERKKNRVEETDRETDKMRCSVGEKRREREKKGRRLLRKVNNNFFKKNLVN